MTLRRNAPSKGERTISVFWSERAISDLEAIADFIAADNPSAAERWIAQLIARAERAAATPLAGRRAPELGREDIREVFRRTYRIIYRVRPTRLEVLTVFEGHRQFPEGLGSDEQ